MIKILMLLLNHPNTNLEGSIGREKPSIRYDSSVTLIDGGELECFSEAIESEENKNQMKCRMR